MNDEKNLTEREDVSFGSIIGTGVKRVSDFWCHIWRSTTGSFQGVEVFWALEDLLATEVTDLKRDIAIKENIF